MGRALIAVVSALIGAIAGISLTTMMCAVGWRFDPRVWGTGAQWAGAIASTCAVIVAIWGDRLRRYFAKPLIALSLTEREGVSVLTSVLGQDGIPMLPRNAQWLHVTASNPTRWFAAKEVSVYLLRVEVREDEQWAETWVSPVPLNWRNDDQPTRNLGPEWDADVIRVFGNELSFATRRGAIQPATFPRQGAIELRLELQARGLDLDPPKLHIAVAWDGVDPDNGGRLNAALVSPTER